MPLIGVAGDLVEDIVVWVSEHISYGTDTPARVFHLRGGSAANVAHAVSVQGGNARLLTRVGDDVRGEWLCAELEKSGVQLRAQRGKTSDSIVVLIDKNGERTMLPDRRNTRDVENFDPAWLAGLAWLHVPLYGFETLGERRVFTELCAEATRAQIPISVDVSSLGLIRFLGVDLVLDILATLNPRIVFANSDEARQLDFLHRTPNSATAWVLKNGADPVVLRTHENTWEIPVPRVTKVIDTTGAGDHFAAGFITTLAGQRQTSASLTRATQDGITAARHILTTPGAHIRK